MDYKEKYNKLVEAIKVLQETNPSDEGIQNWVNDNVPELASEDERIRKEIIDFATKANNGVTSILANNYDFNSWLAWLDKQGEQEPAELPKGEDYGIDGLWHAINILQRTLGEVEGYQSDDGILEHKCAITAVKKLYEQNPTWSEEDIEMLNSAISFVEHSAFTTIGKGKNNVISWLKSLRERIGE